LAVGEEHYFEAAMCFFRAQKVYPSPVELIMIYQKTVPEPVFQLVVGMMTLEVSVINFMYLVISACVNEYAN
jgi:import receptor subunit TOM20